MTLNYPSLVTNRTEHRTENSLVKHNNLNTAVLSGHVYGSINGKFYSSLYIGRW